MNPQPDFNRIFKDCFAAAESGVTYEVRNLVNAPHDVWFLSSLIHDARFRKAHVTLSDGTLTIPLARDRWERYDRDAPALESCAAALRGTHVRSLTWDRCECSEGELWIDYLWLDESFTYHDDSPFNLILAGEQFRLIISMDRDDYTFVLTDLHAGT